MAEPIWDVVIIGAGMGGGLGARSLSEAGFKVLLVDRGNNERSATPNNDTIETALANCKWPGPSACEVDGTRTHHFGIFGSGLGGSTNLYAGALERFERHDLDSRPDLPHPTGGWAFGYDQLVPYYERAERMLHVAGTPDPLNPDSVKHLMNVSVNCV
jgi:choline dehydrogenase-like flavoprotein